MGAKLTAAILIILFLAGASWANYLGEYDDGDGVEIVCVVNDNGTAADSVSGDTVAAYIYGNGNPLDTISLAVIGAIFPHKSSFGLTYTIDTTGAGYGSYYALLYAADVGAGTRDPAGVVTWSVWPRAASATGFVDSVAGIHFCDTLGLVGTVTGNVDGTVATVTGNVNGNVAGNVQGHVDSVGILGAPTIATIAQDAADSVDAQGLSVDSVRAVGLLQNVPMAYLGEYQQDDSIRIATRHINIDSAKAYTYHKNDAVDTVDLAANGFGYGATIEADTTGAGWGSWYADIRGFRAGADLYSRVTWSLRDHHAYAQETAESADVYIHDPDDSTVALVVRDTMLVSAMQDSIDSVLVRQGTIDTSYIHVDQWPDLADAFAESVWTGSSYTKILDDATYTMIAETVAAHVANLDTINYVAHVGSVTVVDTVINVYRVRLADSLTKCATTDSTGIATFVDSGRIFREITLPVDSVIGVFRLERGDSIGKVATVDSAGLLTLADSLRIVRGITLPVDSVIGVFRLERGDSIGKVATVDSAGLLTTADSLRIVRGVTLPIDSVIAVWKADSVGLVAVVDTTKKTGWVGVVDTTRKTGWAGEVDTVSKVGVAILVDSASQLFHSYVNDSTGRTARADTVPRVGKAWNVDSARAVGKVDSTAEVGIVHEAEHLDSVDAAKLVHLTILTTTATTVDTVKKAGWVGIADTVALVGTVTRSDSVIGVYKTWNAIHLDSADAVQLVWRSDSNRVTRQVLWSDSTGLVTHVETVDSSGLLGSIADAQAVAESVWARPVTGHVVSTMGSLLVHTDERATTAADSLSQIKMSAIYVDGDSIPLFSAEGRTIADSVWLVLHDTLFYTQPSFGWILGGLRPDELATESTIVYRIDSLFDNGTVYARDLGLTDSIYLHMGISRSDSTSDSTVTQVVEFIANNLGTNDPTAADISDSVWAKNISAYGKLTAGSLLAHSDTASQAASDTADAILDTLRLLTSRVGQTGDSTIAMLLESTYTHLNVTTVTGAVAKEIADSVLTAVIDTQWYADGTIGFDTDTYDSGSVASFVWDGGSGVHRQLSTLVDTSTLDTSGTKLGAIQASGSPIEGAVIYVYSLADSGWSSPLFGSPVEQADATGWYRIWVTRPKIATDTIFYRVRFHAPPYTDQEKIVRFPQ